MTGQNIWSFIYYRIIHDKFTTFFASFIQCGHLGGWSFDVRFLFQFLFVYSEVPDLFSMCEINNN
jgi:hypothetical protein